MIREHTAILHLVTLRKKKNISIIKKTYHRSGIISMMTIPGRA